MYAFRPYRCAAAVPMYVGGYLLQRLFSILPATLCLRKLFVPVTSSLCQFLSILSSRDKGRRRAPSIMGADLKTDLGVCDWCSRRQRSPEEEHTNGSSLERYELSSGSMAACPVQGGFFLAIKSSLSCCNLSRSHT